MMNASQYQMKYSLRSFGRDNKHLIFEAWEAAIQKGASIQSISQSIAATFFFPVDSSQTKF